MIPSQPTRRPGRPPKTRTWSGNATTPALIEIGFLELIRFLESASTQACVVHTLYIFSAVAAKQNRVYEASGHSKQGEFLPWKYRRVTWKKFGEEQQQKTGGFSTQQRTLVKKGWQAQPPAMRNRTCNAEDKSQAKEEEARCSRRPGTQLATWP